jgi:hypothetical protein
VKDIYLNYNTNKFIMSDAAAPAIAKSPKKKAAAKPKKPTTHPKYNEMVKQAVSSLKERGGSSRQAILKYILKNFDVGKDEKPVNSRLKLALRAGVKNDSLKQSKGTGASGSFKLGSVAEKKPKKKVAKKPAAKKVKKPAAKKTPTKKAAKPKSPKKKAVKKPAAAKKPVAKKPAAKKPAAKKPAAKKPAAKKPAAVATKKPAAKKPAAKKAAAKK